jgi:DNA-binding response OmpR family regulator
MGTRSTSPSAARRTILVAEDDEAVRELLRRILERAGYAVVTAANGIDALRAFRAAPTDLVVTDVMMPGIDGFGLIRALLAEYPEARILAISGAEDRIGFLRLTRDIGALAGLQKPVIAHVLLESVSRLLKRADAPHVADPGAFLQH